MVQRLPRRLSPKAKQRLVRAGADDAGADDTVRALVSVAAGADDLLDRVAALGGTVGSFDRETGLLTVELPAAALGHLAELSGVVHVDADDLYRPS